jgi:hypothetical protein
MRLSAHFGEEDSSPSATYDEPNTSGPKITKNRVGNYSDPGRANGAGSIAPPMAVCINAPMGRFDSSAARCFDEVKGNKEAKKPKGATLMLPSWVSTTVGFAPFPVKPTLPRER